MSEILLSILLELSAISLLAVIYYFWQRHRILYGPRNWQESKLHELHQLALQCARPVDFPQLSTFLDEAEACLNSTEPWLKRDFLERWQKAELPLEIKEILSDCLEWLNQSQSRKH